ncbi:MAG: restriction endonuclease subunit S, partial [Candidatus Aenigmatarchaeota archaeon]
MSNDKIKIKISDIGKTITGKTPSSKNPEEFGNEYMFVTPSDSFEDKYIETTERYLSKIGKNKLKNKLLPPRSILVTCIGSQMGKVALNKSECFTNQQINSILPNGKFDTDYIYYALKLNYEVFRNIASSSTALPILNKNDFDNIELFIHEDINYQKKIANILSVIDEKISLNKKINTELENLAKTIYNYWFVQFDFPYDFEKNEPCSHSPEDKKQNKCHCKPYKTSGGEMVWNEALKREIPKGWEAVSLKDKLEFERGVEPGSDKYFDKPNKNTIPFYKVGGMDGNTDVWIEKEAANGAICKEDDILLSLDGSVGRIAIGLNGAYSSGIRKVYQKEGYFPNSYIYFLLHSD